LIERIVSERGERSCDGSFRDLFDLLVAADPEGTTPAAERPADQVATIVARRP